MTAEPGRTSLVTVILGLLALLCFFLGPTCVVWLFATPVEESTIVTDGNGQVIQRESETDLKPMILAAVFLAASLVCFVASIAGLIKLRRRSGVA